MSNARRPKQRRTTRPARRTAPGQTADRRRWWLFGALAVVGMLAVVVAVAIAAGDDDEPVVVAEAQPREIAAVRIDSDGPLTPSVEEGIIPIDTDVAVGMRVPRLVGLGFDGVQQRFVPNGQPTVYVFAAHWCPNCQTGLPLIQQWRDSGQLPKDVRWLTVSTAANESQPNWPPSSWFRSIGWNAPVIVDSATNDAALAFGVGTFPYFVVTGADGRVVQRATGELTLEQLEGILDPLVGT